ncbi:sensor domain-containing protein [Pseudonocardia benzenivorans]
MCPPSSSGSGCRSCCSLRAARGLATVERRSTEAVLGRPLPPHHYREPTGRGLRRMLRSLAEPQSWRDLLHAVVGFPLRLTCFIVAVVWTAVALGSTLYVTWQWALPYDAEFSGLYGIVAGQASRLIDVAITTAGGIVLLLLLPVVLRVLVIARAAVARGLLTNQSAALRAGPPSWRRAGGLPSRPRPRRCAASSVTSTTARSSGSCGSRWTSRRSPGGSTTTPTAPVRSSPRRWSRAARR